jgi:uncharacterized RDD family membrane protein YckC
VTSAPTGTPTGTPTNAAFQGRTAGIVTRVMAAVVDALVVVVLLVVVWAGIAAARFVTRPARFSVPSPSWTTVVSVSCAVSVVYLAAGWATSGRSCGDQLLGLRVVGLGAPRIGWLRSVLRAAAYVVFPIGLAWSIVDPKNRSLQDLLLGSRVVYDWVPRLPPTG